MFIPDSSFICVFNCMYTSIIIQYSQEVSCAGNQITMNENIQDIMQAKLFSGLSQKDVCRLLACLKAQPVNYARETVVVEEGCPVKNSGFSWQEEENHTKQIPRAIPLQSHF